MSELAWRETGPFSGTIASAEGRTLADYSWGTDKNHPYYAAVRPLQHDGVLTTTAPWDHRWHHGLWWSWKFINDVLYWEDHAGYGNGNGTLGRSLVTEHAVTARAGTVQIDEHVEWRPDDEVAPVLSEQRRVTAHTEVEGIDAWALDWDCQWTAMVPVELSVTPYPEHWWGGYAGLNYRAARSMASAETLLASGGRRGRDAVHSHPAEWAALLGNVDGAGNDEPNDPAFGGMALLAHPDNGTDLFYAFSAADEFGFLASAPLMHESRRLATGEALRLQYRVVILGTAVDHATLDTLSRQYGAARSGN